MINEKGGKGYTRSHAHLTNLKSIHFLQVAGDFWNLILLDPTLILPRLIERSRCQNRVYIRACTVTNQSHMAKKNNWFEMCNIRKGDFGMGLEWYMAWLSQLSSDPFPGLKIDVLIDVFDRCTFLKSCMSVASCQKKDVTTPPPFSDTD